MSPDTSKNIFSVPCIEVCNWFKWLKKSANNSTLTSYLSLNHSARLWFCSFKKAPISLRRLATFSRSFFVIINGCSERTKTRCIVPPSRHTKHQTNEYIRVGIWCDWQQIRFWNLSLLEACSQPDFLGEEDNTINKQKVFLFHETRKALFGSNHGWSTIGTSRHAASPRKLINEGSTFWSTLLLWFVWQVKKEIVPRSPQ